MSTSTKNNWRHKLHEVIAEADTPVGKFFDVALLILILLSVALVMVESISGLPEKVYYNIYVLEWIITILFSLEYIARILSVKKPRAYIFSFYGIIDLLATLPLYLSFVFVGSNYLLTVRALRLLRIFRILKITRYLGEAEKLKGALAASRAKVFVFLFAVLITAIIFGTLMYLIEGEDSGFTSIPRSIYWCIVTLTTVGFGDIAPVTPLGQFLASIIMILGYGIIAVPTGIVSAEYAKQPQQTPTNTQACRSCGKSKHPDNAVFCSRCGDRLNPE